MGIGAVQAVPNPVPNPGFAVCRSEGRDAIAVESAGETALSFAWEQTVMIEPATQQMDELLPFVYSELHRLARQHLSRERPNHSLSPTALINEAYIELSSARVPWQNYEHFLGIAALAMRRVLRSYARRRKAAKRNGVQIAFTGDEAISAQWDYDDLDAALDKLEAESPGLSQVALCRFFGGMSVEQTAAFMEISPATVKRRWSLARAWLLREMGSAAK
jgi:RNA polymerase sigma-70 factor, ECF subfamily